MSKRNIVHVDLPAADRDKANAFFKDLFGWECTIVTEPSTAYIFSSGNTSGAYVELSDQVKPNSPVIYVDSSDLEADLKKAESLGATIAMQPLQIGKYGAMAMFIDPTGNSIALWKDAGAN